MGWLRRCADWLAQLARARRVADLATAATLPDRYGERRRRLAEPDLGLWEFCTRTAPCCPHSSTPQIERAWDAWQAGRHRRGEVDQRPAYTGNPFPGWGLLGRLEQTIASGEGVTVAVHGEAGIGKTQLLTHLSEVAAARHAEAGLLIGYGQAMMNSLGSDSFQAVRDCLRTLALSAERSGSRERLNRLAESFLLHAPDWVQSVPLIGCLLAAGIKTGRSAIAAQDRHAEMNSQLDQLVRFIEDLLERGPLFLILDDLQWADTATVDLVMALALKVCGPLMLVIAYRPGDLFAGKNEVHPMRRAMFRLFRYRDDSVELELRALSTEETGRLVRRITGSTHVSERTVDRIIGLSAGSPLFAETLSRLGGSLVAMDRRVSTP